jgi:arginase
VPAVIALPYHQDERLSDRCIVLPAAVAPDIVDPELPEGDQWSRLVALYDALADRVAQRAQEGAPTSVVTGDCLATLGTLAGLQRAGHDPALVWFDAHGDVHTLESSTSGYLGGMALRMAMGADAARLGGPLGLRPLPESRAVLIDARDLDPAEATYLSQSSVRRSTVEQVSAEDLPDGPVLLHVDVDVIDASEIPGLRFPSSPGPTTSSVVGAVARLVASGRVVGLDIACPWLDPSTPSETERRKDLLARLLSAAGS